MRVSLFVASVSCAIAIASPVLAQRNRASGPGASQQPQQQQQSANFGDPLPGLTNAQRALFDDGRTDFEEIETVADGLGPVFNGRSCGECHGVPALGGTSRRTVTRIGARNANGTFNPLTNLGGSLLQDQGIEQRDGSTHRFRGERVPAEATIVARRRSVPLFGLGLVDATPDSTFIALAAQQAARGDGVAGRVALVDNPAAGLRTVGKFGWKAQVATILMFSADAYRNELGITNPDFPDEACPQGNCAELSFNPLPGLNDGGEGVQALADFMTFLAAPPRGQITNEVREGEQLFARIGCDVCHTPSLRTGQSRIAALDRKTYSPYSDFLLHDMGALGDGVEQGAGTGREFRTPPLWGLRTAPSLLHDGRTTSIEEAVLAHDGQGRAARDRFAALDGTARARLMAFLRSL
jgi:CxxC motif-containing protein (DUF1111 family)